MRKPVEIDLGQSGNFRRTLVSVARYMPFDGKVEMTSARLIALQGTARLIINQSIAEYAQATVELFGKEDYTPEELASLHYLKSL